jgi:Ni,Fe-hydrogenase III large subunit
MKVDDGVTTVTRGIDSSSTTATVNTEIAAVMMTGGYTKETIASALEVLAGGDVTVKISSNGGVPISIFKMDTIAENVAMALGLSFSNMNKRFQSSMSLEKRSTRF